MGTARPDPRAAPFFFMKPPTTTIAGPVASVPLPLDEAPDYDWEGELAIVIGRRGKHITDEDAASHVAAGYTVADDLSARGRFQRPKAVEPFTYDWLGQKAQDGSCPIGPGIAPAWAVPDIEDQRMRLWVNGDLKQDTLIGELVVGIAGLVSAASDLVTLEPGDLILTGTPAGVGLPRDTFLAVGDVVEVEIGGIGRITHTIARRGPGRTSPGRACCARAAAEVVAMRDALLGVAARRAVLRCLRAFPRGDRAGRGVVIRQATRGR